MSLETFQIKNGSGNKGAQVIENEEGCDKWNQEQQQLKNKKRKARHYSFPVSLF